MSNEALKGLLLIGEDVEYHGILIRNYKLGEIFKDLKLDKYYKLISLANVELKDILQVDKVDINKLNLYEVLYDVYNDWLLEFLNTFTYLQWENGMFRDFVSYDDGKRIRFTKDKFDGFMEVFKKMYCVNRGSKSKSKFDINLAVNKDDEMKEMLEELAEAERKAREKKGSKNITLSGIITGICSKKNSYDLFNVWNLTVYQLMVQYYGIEQEENYTHILDAIYAGTYDLKKNKVNLESLHWANEIDLLK